MNAENKQINKNKKNNSVTSMVMLLLFLPLFDHGVNQASSILSDKE